MFQVKKEKQLRIIKQMKMRDDDDVANIMRLGKKITKVDSYPKSERVEREKK
jgi:hypothetical protein